MNLSNFLSLVTVFVLILATLNTHAANSGQDGNTGEVGKSGADGRSGRAGINWVPRDPNPEYFFYFPIKNRELAEFKKVLLSGAKVNWPMSNIIGRPSAFEVAMEECWLDGIKVMLENPDIKNKPDFAIRVKATNGSLVNIYEFLTIGDYLDEKGKLTSPKFVIRTAQLEILRLVLKYENNLEFLEHAIGATLPISEVLPALSSVANPFFTHPNNIEARQLIEGRLAELRAKQ